MRDYDFDFDGGAFILVAALVVMAAWGVASAGWTTGLWVLQFAAIVAALTGGVLAYSQFDANTSAIIAGCYGLGWVGFLLAAVLPQDLTWNQRSLQILARLLFFFKQLAIGGRSEDTLMFVLVHAVLFWMLGVACTWHVLRHGNVWAGCLPGVVVLIINLVYYNGPAPVLRFLALYLGVALLLLARTHVWEQQARWRAARVGFSPEIRFESWRAALAASAIILALSWGAPGFAASPHFASAWQTVTSPYKIVRSTWQRMFATIYGAAPGTGDYYGSSLSLGGSVQLTDRQIMDVRVAPGLHYYWRARTFDHYQDGQWTAPDTALVPYQAHDPGVVQPIPGERPLVPESGPPGLVRPLFASRQAVSATFYMYTPATSALYGVPQPYAFSRDVNVEAVVNAAKEFEVLAALSTNLLPKGSSYTVISSLSVANEDELRQAGADYPPEIVERYLQLPDTISERTLRLSRDVAGAPPTPYDSAVSVQRFLRGAIAYSLDIPEPPDGQDPIDWALFDQREGYCNYYASAMVVMLRAAGIPARVSVGFAQGAYDAEGAVFRVVESNAHAWPEVYFPGYGWVEFEPTPSQPVIDRTPAAIAESAQATLDDSLAEQLEAEPTPQRSDAPASAAESATAALSANWLWLAALAAGAGAWLVWRTRQRRWQASPVATAYARLEGAARLVGVRPAASWTARERAEALARLLPGRRVEIDQIITEYEAEIYSRRSQPGEDVQEAWRRLAPAVWFGAVSWSVRRLVRR